MVTVSLAVGNKHLFSRFGQALCPKKTNIMTSGDNYSIVISVIIVYYIE
jgi:hypothetical protein